MTTYTVFQRDDSSIVLGRGLSAIDAMDEILSHDGYRWEILTENSVETMWSLWHSCASQNSTWGATQMAPMSIYGFGTKAEARQEIADQVVHRANQWRRSPSVMTDEAYDKMMAELAAELASKEG